MCKQRSVIIVGGDIAGLIAAKKELAEPTANTIYFAGEAVYEGLMQGTVEAALQSGIETAEKMI